MKANFLWVTLVLTFTITHLYSQTYFRVEQDFPDGYNGQYSVNLSTLQSYTDDRINAAFAAIVSSNIYFKYPQGGCQNRAEMMHIILENQLHLQHAKIWIFAPVDLYPNDNRHLEIADPNGNAINNVITWKYHVAPVLLRKNSSNSIDTVVIDPSIDHTQVMRLRDWLKSMKNSNVSKYTFLESKWYAFYTKQPSSVINGFFYPYSSHWVEDYHRSTMERGLAANDLARFLMQKLKEGYTDNNGDVKKLLANQDNIYNFFMNPYNTFNGRPELLKNHSGLMRQAEQHYWERLAYWQGEVNRILQVN